MAVKKTSQKVLSKVQRVAREQAIIRDLHTGTMSYRVIAAKHHVSLPTVNAKARKAGITRRRGRVSKAIVGKTHTQTTAKTRMHTVARTFARRVKTRTARRAYVGGGAAARFNENFRKLVMSYYPAMPLVKFERLTKIIRQAVTL
jgi:hypothetical protein